MASAGAAIARTPWVVFPGSGGAVLNLTRIEVEPLEPTGCTKRRERQAIFPRRLQMQSTKPKILSREPIFSSAHLSSGPAKTANPVDWHPTIFGEPAYLHLFNLPFSDKLQASLSQALSFFLAPIG